MEEQELNELYEKVLKACKEANNFEMSFIQRTSGFGYADACKIKDMLYENGILKETN